MSYPPFSVLSCLILLSLTLFAPVIVAEPYRPKDDALILERLPGRLASTELQRLRELRALLARNPFDATAAAELAEAYYRLAQRTGDPRQIGYAQSALTPWPPGSSAPNDIRLVRALIAQFLHDFGSALNDLDIVLIADPGNVAALSYRAIIHLVKADYPRALADCKALALQMNGLVARACTPTVQAVTGQSGPARAGFKALLDQYPNAPVNERFWVLNRLAEIEQRLGRPAEAEKYFRLAAALGISDQYLMAGFAEFLLDQGRAPEVIELLQSQTQNDVLLLRLALAEKSLGHPDLKKHQEMLADRYAASRLRGDKLHLADEAIFALHFTRQPLEALRLALENWGQMQREPGDAKILMESAIAAKDPAGAAPALEWLRTSQHEDVVLRKLAAAIEALPGARR